MKLNNKEKILMSMGGVGIGVVSALIYERSKEMFENKKEEKVVTVNEVEGIELVDIDHNDIPEYLSPIEKETISNQIKGMSDEELILVLENIPMDLIFKHIGNVLEKNRKFVQSINEAVANFT